MTYSGFHAWQSEHRRHWSSTNSTDAGSSSAAAASKSFRTRFQHASVPMGSRVDLCVSRCLRKNRARTRSAGDLIAATFMSAPVARPSWRKSSPCGTERRAKIPHSQRVQNSTEFRFLRVSQGRLFTENTVRQITKISVLPLYGSPTSRSQHVDGRCGVLAFIPGEIAAVPIMRERRGCAEDALGLGACAFHLKASASSPARPTRGGKAIILPVPVNAGPLSPIPSHGAIAG